MCIYLSLQQTVNQVDAVSYSLSLNPLDGFEEESLLISTIAVKNGSSVVLTVSLPYRKLWTYTVLAHGCEEHPLLETNELSNYMHNTNKCTCALYYAFRHP